MKNFIECPNCETKLLPNAKGCQKCGWGIEPTVRREPMQKCPGCGQSIPLHDIKHGCGWMTWRERLIQDAMRTSPKEALARLRKAENLRKSGSRNEQG